MYSNDGTIQAYARYMASAIEAIHRDAWRSERQHEQLVDFLCIKLRCVAREIAKDMVAKVLHED